jgi:hypothetical protein
LQTNKLHEKLKHISQTHRREIEIVSHTAAKNDHLQRTAIQLQKDRIEELQKELVEKSKKLLGVSHEHDKMKYQKETSVKASITFINLWQQPGIKERSTRKANKRERKVATGAHTALWGIWRTQTEAQRRILCTLRGLWRTKTRNNNIEGEDQAFWRLRKWKYKDERGNGESQVPNRETKRKKHK